MYFEAWLSVLLTSSLFPSGCRRCSMPVFTSSSAAASAETPNLCPWHCATGKVMQGIWLLRSAFQTLREFADCTYCLTQIIYKEVLGTMGWKVGTHRGDLMGDRNYWWEHAAGARGMAESCGYDHRNLSEVCTKLLTCMSQEASKPQQSRKLSAALVK